jgi:hypothetical protein
VDKVIPGRPRFAHAFSFGAESCGEFAGSIAGVAAGVARPTISPPGVIGPPLAAGRARCRVALLSLPKEIYVGAEPRCKPGPEGADASFAPDACCWNLVASPDSALMRPVNRFARTHFPRLTESKSLSAQLLGGAMLHVLLSSGLNSGSFAYPTWSAYTSPSQQLASSR